MRSPSGPRPHARRVRRYLHSVPIVTIAACAVLVIAAGCSKGRGAAPSKSPTASASASVPASATGMPVYNVSVKNFTYHGMPSTVPANKPIVVSFTNKESFSIDHEFVVLKLPAGKTAQDVIKDAKKNGPDAEDHWIHFADSGDPLPTNSGTAVSMDLAPGNYVATCWQTGKAGGGTGPPHVTIGMIAPFTAS